MRENFEIVDEVTKGLETTLNVKLQTVEVEDGILDDEKEMFVDMITGIQNLIKRESSILQSTGLDVSPITVEYWNTIKDLMDFNFGESVDAVVWFLFDKPQNPGKLFEDKETGDKHDFKNASELYKYLLYKIED